MIGSTISDDIKTKTYLDGAPNIDNGKAYNLKLQVSSNKRFKLFLDGKQLSMHGGPYETTLPTIGRGGVAIGDLYQNSATFENFQLTKIVV